jgi:hypothetical protein
LKIFFAKVVKDLEIIKGKRNKRKRVAGSHFGLASEPAHGPPGLFPRRGTLPLSLVAGKWSPPVRSS